jgi:hypothetical protein
MRSWRAWRKRSGSSWEDGPFRIGGTAGDGSRDMQTRQYFVDQATEVDVRESKLPVWAQDKLNTLRRAAIEARNELAQLRGATEPSLFWLDNWHGEGNRFYLPTHAGELNFASGDGELSLSTTNKQEPDGYLRVIGRDGLIIKPWASNVVLIKGGES